MTGVQTCALPISFYRVPEDALHGLGKPLAVLVMAKYAKGDYRTMVHFSYLVRTIPGLQVYGISCDAEEADATAMLKKMGTAMPTQSLDELLFDYTLAYDAGSAVKKSIMETCGLNTIAPGFAFLYDKSKNMVWKEVFTSSWALKQGQFAESCALCVAGKPLFDNGERPVVEDDESEDDESGGEPSVVGCKRLALHRTTRAMAFHREDAFTDLANSDQSWYKINHNDIMSFIYKFSREVTSNESRTSGH